MGQQFGIDQQILEGFAGDRSHTVTQLAGFLGNHEESWGGRVGMVVILGAGLLYLRRWGPGRPARVAYHGAEGARGGWAGGAAWAGAVVRCSGAGPGRPAAAPGPSSEARPPGAACHWRAGFARAFRLH